MSHSATDRFENWIASPKMLDAERAFRDSDAFWAKCREDGLRNRNAAEAKARRLEYEGLKERMES